MAVTKLYTKSISYNVFEDTTNRIYTDGYKSAKIVITVDTPTAGSAGFNIRNDKDVNMLMLNNEIGSTSNVAIDYRGGSFKQEYLVDLTTTASVVVKYSKSNDFAATKASVEVFFSYEEVGDIDSISIIDIFEKGYKDFDVKDKLFKATLVFNDEVPTNPQIIINGSTDGTTWSGNINFVSNSVENNSVYLYQGKAQTLWLNAESYKKIRIKCNNTIRQHLGVRCEVEQVHSFEREFKAASVSNTFGAIGGGKFIKLRFDNFTVTNGSCTVVCMMKNENGDYINPNIYTLDGKPVIKNVFSDTTFVDGSQNKCFILSVQGETLNGGLILKYDEWFSSESLIRYKIPASKIIVDGDSPTINRSMYVTISDKPFEPVENKEELLVSRNDYDIYNVNIDGKVVDAVNEDVIIRTATNSFKYCRFGIYGLIYDITLDASHCPSLITGENVKFAKLVNYENRSFNYSMTRVLLFTDKNRILYNRVKDDAIGINYFREAPLYNLKKKFYPVNSKSDVSAVAKYLPIFPDYDYNQFDGRIYGTDEFGLALPTRGTTVGTLLEDWKKLDKLDRVAYSSIVLSNAYGCIFGNYGKPDTDPWVAVSCNGKEFFIIETWASVEDYTIQGITTSRVDLSTIISNAGGFTSGSLKVTRRMYNVPNSQTKEPTTPFIIGASCIVSSISVENNRTYLSFVDDSAFSEDEMTAHRFNNMAPIVFFENISASSEYDYICNNVKADGSDNTGVYFRLHRVSTNRYELLADMGDPFEGKNVCRHIHSVSEAYGGILVATGENYRHINNEPFFDGGFMYFITADAKFAATPLQYTLANVASYFFGTFRITSSEKGINRACGAVMRGDKKIVFVSDSVQGDRDVNNVSIEGRTETLNCKSYGVYMGDIADCDDWSKFKNVCNMYDAGLGLVEHNGRLGTCGYAGPIHISPDYGDTWYTENIGRKNRNKVEISTNPLEVTGLAGDGSMYYGNNRIVWKK